MTYSHDPPAQHRWRLGDGDKCDAQLPSALRCSMLVHLRGNGLRSIVSRRRHAKVPHVIFVRFLLYPTPLGNLPQSKVLCSRTPSLARVICTLKAISERQRSSPLPPVDNHLLSTQHPSEVPIIPLPGITLPGFASRHAAEWFHRSTETLCD
jgi:hypothetical protein